MRYFSRGREATVCTPRSRLASSDQVAVNSVLVFVSPPPRLYVEKDADGGGGGKNSLLVAVAAAVVEAGGDDERKRSKRRRRTAIEGFEVFHHLHHIHPFPLQVPNPGKKKKNHNQRESSVHYRETLCASLALASPTGGAFTAVPAARRPLKVSSAAVAPHRFPQLTLYKPPPPHRPSRPSPIPPPPSHPCSHRVSLFWRRRERKREEGGGEGLMGSSSSGRRKGWGGSSHSNLHR